MLIDPYGRVLTNLRISVTNRCNLKCIYCHREGEKSGGEIDVERIAEISEAFLKLGLKKVKITGGEPLLRKDIFDIILALSGFEEISMTTNGTFLAEKAYELKECGLDRINISLDTLNAEKYEFITGSKLLNKVLDGVEAAVNAKLTPIKLNMVLLKVNFDEVDEMLSFANSFNKKDVKVILQVIELIPNKKTIDYYVDLDQVERKFREMAFDVKVRAMHRRHQYWTSKGVIEFVKPLDNSEFCRNCNRIRVTSDGKIKLCIFSDLEIPTDGLGGDEIIKVIKDAVKLRKPRFASLNDFKE
ncbi:MAG: GTP 3',8-cyclase MoaA [Archaeoglobaceae archaeon]|nr:GTP 3',8-cyclase MoaA [Archaeoglobaceae archaeon]MCX8151948.1 GTP 3',8-cyclase MoaA [Archaeoglobaceae archaeon]MDW8013337.1 GTP 3',8-cyclase MoaA [Archaeoglobaceae archaeon]